MTTVVLVRHGLTHMTGPVLAGWTPGLHLDERGQKQAAAVAERLKPVTFDAEFLGSSAVSVEGQSWGSKAGFAATTTVNRKDWGINWNKTLDNGGVMVDDNVTIVLNVEADKAQDKAQ